MTSTVLTAWTATLLRALEEWGIDGRALALSCGIPADALEDPDRRVPLEASSRLWHAAAEATGDPCIGIGVSRFVRPGTFHALGQAILVSPTWRSALERVARYSTVTADVAVADVAETEEGVELTIGFQPGAVRPSFESIDAIVATLVRTSRFMLDRSVEPVRVELERPEPTPAAPIDQCFRCPVVYEAPAIRVIFDHETANRPVPGGHAEIARLNDSVVEQYLAALAPASTARQVRQVLVEVLPEGEPSVGKVAEQLHVSTRTLQRNLKEEGVSFSDLLSEVRRELAVGYLRAGEHSVTEVTYLLGFSESAAFSRAFKRWMGVAPSQFR